MKGKSYSLFHSAPFAKSIIQCTASLLLTGAFLFDPGSAHAQGAACSGAVSVTVDGACPSGTITDNTVNDAPAPSCFASPGGDGWYSFVATTAAADVTANSGNKQLLVQVLSGTCGSLTEIGCANAVTTAGAQTETVNLTGLTIGATYYIRIANQNANNMTLTSLCVTSVAPAIPNCPTINSPAASATNICMLGTTLTWTAATTGTPATGYDVYFGTTNPPTTLVSSNQSGTTYSTGALSANTTYYWRIAPKNSVGTNSSCSIQSFTTGPTFSASNTTPINDGFESCMGWTIVNGSQTNKWVVGTATNNGGSNSIYISNDNGTSNAYTNSSSSTVHFYKDITFPASPTCNTLSFDWKANGESCCDYLQVFLVPTTTTPVAGTTLSSGQLGSNMNVQTAWTTTTVTLPASAAGTTMRLVFSWRNDGSLGSNVPAAIDNISVTTSTAPAPVCATTPVPSNAATNICPSSLTSLSWTAPAVTGCNGASGYDVYFGTSATPPLVSSNQSGTTYTLPALSNSTTYYWKIVPRNSGGAATGCSTWSFTTGSITGACNLGTGVYNITLPYSAASQTTCGMVDDLTSTNISTCGSTSYLTGEDVVYVFTPAASGSITITLTSTGSYTGLMLYSGCPLSTGCYSTAPTCVSYEQSSTGSKSMCANVTAGVTYYLIVDSWASPVCNPYSINITSPSGITAGTTCSNPVTITLPYSATSQTTACMGNDYTSSSTGSCGSLYESGEDKVYAYTATGSECISVTLSNASTSSIGFQVYSGCPGSAGTTCIGSFGGSNPLSGTVTLPSAGTYYIIVDTWASPNNASYDIAIASFGSGPSNDLPCNATPLSLNVYLTGNNSCSGGSGEPSTPSCWTAGSLNTIWYSVVCPSSGQLKIRTILGSLTNTQIALYSGSCSSLTMVSSACNDDAPTCGSSSYSNSEITATGLTAGATYYIRVDGYSSLTGSFDIIAVDGSIGFPPAAGQDCFIANPVCNQTIAVGNPGYTAYGNNCDFSGTGICLASGERGSAWYQINISANGTLQFDIVPNDWPGAPSTSSTDYDFAVWKVAGSGATTCAGILAGAVPVACNYSGLGVTGCAGATGNAPAAYPGYDGAYEPQISVSNGDIYMLVISNFSNSTSGFTLNFSSTAPINYTPSATSITWSGGTSTAWAVPSNWGGCNIPSCSVDAVIVPSSTAQPVISANATVKNLTINPGATLTINAGVTLTICGDFTNNGNLIASPTSTILFNNGNVVHNLNGSMVGSDKFGNLVITKTGGSVSLNQDLDIGGSFTTSNSTSVLNTNGKYIKIAGNFNNNAAGTTFTNVTGGTLEFNGTSAQTYTPGGSLTLNNVVMNHTGTGVTLSGNHMILGTAGTLTLTQGKIITGNLEVQVNNTAPAAVTTGNTTSFVQGYLRRKLQSTGSYDLPVGEATKGYQRANVTFTAATTIDNLLASFSTYATVPAALNVSECATTYNMPALNNGKWTISAFNSSNTQISGNGTYDMTLYNLAGSYNNQTGANGWTVMKDPGTGWGLNGTCVISSINAVQRTGMSGFSNFGTAQATTPLPIELVSFTGQSLGKANLLEWTTASETNNDYFTLEHSSNGIDFEEVTRVDGAGTSTQINGYHATDNYPYSGVTYYRLRQTDFNGNFTYSGLIALENHLDEISIDNIHPNPTNGDINFDFATPLKGTITVEIVDAYGKLVRRKTMEVSEGRNRLMTEMGDLAPGIYTLKVNFAEANYTSISKIVKY